MQIASIEADEAEFVELIPLTEDLMLGVTIERGLWLINQTASPKRAVQIGIYTGSDTERLKMTSIYVVHGGERHPNMH